MHVGCLYKIFIKNRNTAIFTFEESRNMYSLYYVLAY